MIETANSSIKSTPPMQMQTKRTVPEFNPSKVPMSLPPIYTSTNFDASHVVAAPSKAKAEEKRKSRGVKVSTIVDPTRLEVAMGSKSRALHASATSGAAVELSIPAGWSNAVTANETNTYMTDKLKVNTRLATGKYEVYHLDEDTYHIWILLYLECNGQVHIRL